MIESKTNTTRTSFWRRKAPCLWPLKMQVHALLWALVKSWD